MLKELVENIGKTKSLSLRQRYFWFRGLFSKKHSCGKKNKYSLKSSIRAKEAMEKKYLKEFDVYRCIWCGTFHIGASISKYEV